MVDGVPGAPGDKRKRPRHRPCRLAGTPMYGTARMVGDPSTCASERGGGHGTDVAGATPVNDEMDVRGEFRAEPRDGIVNLAGYDPSATPFVDDEDDADDELDEMREQLFDLHEMMFAAEDRRVLLVLQGPDCSGKNGTIKHVVIAMNPAGVRVASFAEPTEEELDHHFLWRYRRELPRLGRLGVFNRSYYEDVLVPAVSGDPDGDVDIDARLGDIVDFERELLDDTVVVKCFLHISYDEQRRRFLRRLDRDDKRWKFDPADLESRRHWNEAQVAYGTTIAATSVDDAPWYIIPADHKWYRNWAIARILVETFRSMNLKYPQPDLDVEALRAALQPPN